MIEISSKRSLERNNEEEYCKLSKRVLTESDNSRLNIPTVHQPLQKIKTIKINHIEKGAQGSVSRVYAIDLRKFIVIKVFNQDKMNFSSNFKTEAEVYKIIREINIDSDLLDVFTIGMDEHGTFQLYMECGLGDLDNYIKFRKEINKPFSSDELEYITHSLLKTVITLKKYGIYHRDIKPKNIILSSERKVKLADYSLSLIHSGANDSQLLRPSGTPHFMLPKVAEKLKTGERVEYSLYQNDIYAVGRTIELLEVESGAQEKKSELVNIFCKEKPDIRKIEQEYDRILLKPENFMDDIKEFNHHMKKVYMRKMTDDQLLLALQNLMQFLLYDEAFELLEVALECKEAQVFEKLLQVKPRGDKTLIHLQELHGIQPAIRFEDEFSTKSTLEEESKPQMDRDVKDKLLYDIMILSQLYAQKALIFEARNNFEKALNFQDVSIEMKYELFAIDENFEFPKNRNGCLAQSYNNKANIYMKMNQFEEAEKFYIEAIKYKEKQLKRLSKEDDLSLPRYYNNFGMLKARQENLEEAEKWIMKSLELRLAMNAPENDKAASLLSLGTLYSKQKRYEQALDNLTKGISLKQNVVGKYHPEISRTLVTIGNIYKEQNLTKEAIQQYGIALEINERVFGPTHVESINIKKLLSSLNGL